VQKNKQPVAAMR